MPLNIPTEIVLEIASYLGSDDASKNCLALTCRQFYADIMPQVRKAQADHVEKVLLPAGTFQIWKPPLPKPSVTTHEGLADFFHPGINSRRGEPFMGSFTHLKLTPLLSTNYLDCLAPMVAIAPALETIHLRIPASSDEKVLVTAINICAARPGAQLVLDECVGHRLPSMRNRELGGTPMLWAIHNTGIAQNSGSVFRLPIFSLRRTTTTPSRHLPARTPQVSELHITNDVIFLFQIFPVIVTLINTAPLDILTIGRPSLSHTSPRLTKGQWSKILASISTTATRLAFRELPISPRDLFSFLRRHTQVTHLTLSLQNAPDTSLFAKYLIPHLPNLVKLSGTVPSIMPFLRLSKTHFPALRHLDLLRNASTLDDGSYTPEEIDNFQRLFRSVYDIIAMGNFKFDSLNIGRLCVSGLVEWLISSDTPRTLSNINKLVLKGSVFAWAITLGDMMSWIKKHQPILETVRPTAMPSPNPLFPKKISEDIESAILECFLWRSCPAVDTIELLHPNGWTCETLERTARRTEFVNTDFPDTQIF